MEIVCFLPSLHDVGALAQVSSSLSHTLDDPYIWHAHIKTHVPALYAVLRASGQSSSSEWRHILAKWTTLPSTSRPFHSHVVTAVLEGSYTTADASHSFQVLDMVVLGAAGVGKTALTIMYIQNFVLPSRMDVGPLPDSYRKRVVLDNNAMLFNIHDPVGEDVGDGVPPVEGAFGIDLFLDTLDAPPGVILVFDVSRRASFVALGPLVDTVLDSLAPSGHHAPRAWPLVVVGMHWVGDGITGERTVGCEEGAATAALWGAPYFEVEMNPSTSIGNWNATRDAFLTCARNTLLWNARDQQALETAFALSPSLSNSSSSSSSSGKGKGKCVVQ